MMVVTLVDTNNPVRRVIKPRSGLFLNPPNSHLPGGNKLMPSQGISGTNIAV